MSDHTMQKDPIPYLSIDQDTITSETSLFFKIIVICLLILSSIFLIIYIAAKLHFKAI